MELFVRVYVGNLFPSFSKLKESTNLGAKYETPENGQKVYIAFCMLVSATMDSLFFTEGL